MKTKVLFNNLEFSFTDDDVIDLDDVQFAGEYNPHNQRMWLLHDHGVTLCVVMADSLQDALDIAVDNDKLDRFLVTEDQAEDYGGDIYNSDELAYLGNASEPFDIQTLGYVEFALPKRSLTALYGETVNGLTCHVA
jgi:hypothetical protein